MTKAQFLKALAETPRRWKIRPNNFGRPMQIRVQGRAGDYCPITYVCLQLRKKRYGIAFPEGAAKLLGIPPTLRSSIVKAADHDITTFNSRSIRELRRDMLVACGLPKD